MGQLRWIGPIALAGLLTLLNAFKPVVVDDTAYLLFARHLAVHPLEPYDFELFWYAQPQPAMEILAPPVVPYWLAAGIALFGEHLFLLKLWLFPFALVFCHAADYLLRRFAHGTERIGVTLLTLSPAVLPLFNFMLDVPAVALGLAAVAVFIHGCDRQRLGWALLAGVLTGLAMQTKYTMTTVPVVLVWYGLLSRNRIAIGAAGLTTIAVFAGWELFVWTTCGESHFLYHVRDQQIGQDGDWITKKMALWTPLLGHLGWLGLGWGLFAGRAVGFGRWFVVGVAVIAALGLATVCVVPHSQSVLLRNAATGTPRLDLPFLVYLPLGFAVLVTATLAMTKLGFRYPRGPAGMLRHSSGTWFVIGWFLIELLGYFALTPFPAARRIIGVCVVLGVLACVLVARVPPPRRPDRWLLGYGVALGVGLYAIDTWDADAERQLAHRASEVVREQGSGRIWTQGHWGWQYYTGRYGAELIVPNRSELKAGDWLILPKLPDDTGFYRPYHGETLFHLAPWALEPVAEFVADDWLAAQTVPNLYGGMVPVLGRDHPRSRVVVYRVTRDWIPQRR